MLGVQVPSEEERVREERKEIEKVVEVMRRLVRGLVQGENRKGSRGEDELGGDSFHGADRKVDGADGNGNSASSGAVVDIPVSSKDLEPWDVVRPQLGLTEKGARADDIEEVE